MKSPKFKNKDGSLTAYSFACGYLEMKKTSLGYAILELDGCWHVKHFTDSGERILWDCPETLTFARKLYKTIK